MTGKYPNQLIHINKSQELVLCEAIGRALVNHMFKFSLEATREMWLFYVLWLRIGSTFR